MVELAREGSRRRVLRRRERGDAMTMMISTNGPFESRTNEEASPTPSHSSGNIPLTLRSITFARHCARKDLLVCLFVCVFVFLVIN